MFKFLEKLSPPAKIYMVLGMIMLGIQLIVFAFIDGALSSIIPGAVGALLFVYVAIIGAITMVIMYIIALVINWLYKENKYLGWGAVVFLLFGPVILGFFGYEKTNNQEAGIVQNCVGQPNGSKCRLGQYHEGICMNGQCQSQEGATSNGNTCGGPLVKNGQYI